METNVNYMITEFEESNVLVKDANGDWYSIPVTRRQSFLSLREEMMREDPISMEYSDLADRLVENFNIFLC
jgi:hypothetical protein